MFNISNIYFLIWLILHKKLFGYDANKRAAVQMKLIIFLDSRQSVLKPQF
jgi:hypothetical protein